ncbi:MAG: FAD-dependent thymidylate synthase, partial [Anaerolineales bacterium]|nr:FAD-dependent thymidylate synthase [Anaerolineales bacterium]
YQKWGQADFYIPPELEGHPLREGYIQTCHLLFSSYAQSLTQVRELIERQFPPRDTVRAANNGSTPVRDGNECSAPNETLVPRSGREPAGARRPAQVQAEEAYDRRIRSQYVDSCRFLLPAASLANLGMTANARVLENAIRKMRSHPLAEVRQIGEEIKRVAQGEAPTLVKYAEAAPYLVETRQGFEEIHRRDRGERRENKNFSAHSALSAVQDWCTLVDYDPDGETKVLAATLYRFGNMTYPQALQTVRSAPEPERVKLAESLLGRLSRYDIPLRELEHSSYTFDLVLDQGAYAEFKRHRMMTQTPQTLTARLGYALPRRIAEAGFEVPYRCAMEAAAQMYERMAAWNPQVAAYLVPNGFNRRVLFTMNLREAFAFCQLRATENAHFSIRRVALRVTEEIRRVHPLLAKYLHLPQWETWRTIEERYFAATK